MARPDTVYVVQEVEYSRQFKIGRTIDPTGRLDRVDLVVPGEVKPVLIIPTEDAHALEKELHRQYANDRKRGEWFDLNRSQVAELRQLQGVVDLATGRSVNSNSVMDTDTLEQSRRLFELLSNATIGLQDSDSGGDEPASGVSDSSTLAEWGVRSISANDYHNLPKLSRRSGYVCVLRDVDLNKYLIDETDQPSTVVDMVFSEHGASSLELLFILETTNIRKFAEGLAILYPKFRYREWLDLSPVELKEIRNLGSPEYIFGSVYLTPKTHWEIENLPTESLAQLPKVEGPSGYVCIFQGVNPGKRYKIRSTRHPKRMASNPRLGLMLNNPHDFRRSSQPIRFARLIRSRHAKSFERYLRQRFAEHKRRGDWFELVNAHLQELTRLAN